MSDLLVSPEALNIVLGLGQTVVVVELSLLEPLLVLLVLLLLQPALPAAGLRLPASPDLVLLLLAVVLDVLPQAARVRVLLLAARHLTLVGLLES